MREIFIERRENLLRIAIKDQGRLSECFMEEENQGALPGQIYKGIVKNIVPAIKCAFIDIGLQKNAYLYMDNKFGNMRLKKGDEIIVEVLKEEIGDKGAKVTTAYSIAGRYIVINTMKKNTEFSSKISDNDFKDKIRKVLNRPEEVGIMIRTNAQGVEVQQIKNELDDLYEIYKGIKREAAYSIKPKLLYRDEGVLDRVLRDAINESTEIIMLDWEDDYNYVKNYVNTKNDINAAVRLYNEERTMFDYLGIEKDILTLRNGRVNLECGGYIIIEKTEAMYVIDVNSGKNVTSGAIKKTVMVTNLEAARVIPQQVLLRNLSGIIVVDFIDMDDEIAKKEIMNILREGFKDDKNKSIIYPLTELNLIQIARRRKGKSLLEYIEEDCLECKGRGKKIKTSYLLLLIKNEVLKADSEDKIKDFYIEVNYNYEKAIRENILSFIRDSGGLSKNIYLNFTTTVDLFKVEPLIFSNQIQCVEKFKI
jgi:ribonuclease G